MKDVRLLHIAVYAVAACTAGCSSVRQQFRQTVQAMKADAAILDSHHDGLDAFGSADAEHLRAARAEMGR